MSANAIISFTWSLVTCARTLVKLDFFGRKATMRDKLISCMFRFVEVTWRTLSLVGLNALAGNGPNPIMIGIILALDYCCSFFLLGASERQHTLAVRLLFALVMVTASPPSLVPSWQGLLTAYVGIRIGTFLAFLTVVTFLKDVSSNMSQLWSSSPFFVICCLSSGLMIVLCCLYKYASTKGESLSLEEQVKKLNTLFLTAVRHHDPILAGMLQGDGVDIGDSPMEELQNQTFLHAFAHLDLFDSAIFAGLDLSKVDINRRDDKAETILTSAFVHHNTAYVQTLIQAKAEIDPVKDIHLAVKMAAGGDIGLLKSLMDLKCDVDFTRHLAPAVFCGKNEMVQYLLGARACVHTEIHPNRNTSLMNIVFGGHNEVRQTLITVRADPSSFLVPNEDAQVFIVKWARRRQRTQR